MKSTPRFKRICPGLYRTEDEQFELMQLIDVNPPAWNIEVSTDWIEQWVDADPEHRTPYSYPDSMPVDGASSKRDALALFDEWFQSREENAA